MRSAGKNRLTFHGRIQVGGQGVGTPLPLEKSFVAIGGLRISGRDPPREATIFDPLDPFAS